jgi:hypothetical protein
MQDVKMEEICHFVALTILMGHDLGITGPGANNRPYPLFSLNSRTWLFLAYPEIFMFYEQQEFVIINHPNYDRF